VTIGVGNRGEAALMVLSGQPFVRHIPDSTPIGGQIRLYVERGEAAMPAILRLLDGAGLDLETISLSRPSLDDVFLRKTGRSLREVAA